MAGCSDRRSLHGLVLVRLRLLRTLIAVELSSDLVKLYEKRYAPRHLAARRRGNRRWCRESFRLALLVGIRNGRQCHPCEWPVRYIGG
jgi:hypothetical protein